ncbi:chorismate--pyruvate lyase family protein [Cupriavidus basilensis]
MEPALTREVLPICDEQPAIYAHTVVRERHARRDWPFLRGLGERPLGGRLFVDPAVRRDPFQFARLLAAPSAPRRCSGLAGHGARYRCCRRAAPYSGAAPASCS